MFGSRFLDTEGALTLTSLGSNCILFGSKKLPQSNSNTTLFWGLQEEHAMGTPDNMGTTSLIGGINFPYGIFLVLGFILV